MSEHLPERTGPIRIGDAERDQAVEVLSEHFVAGRLTQEEFEERSDQATRARYDKDLSPLFADLPEAVAPQEVARTRARGFRPDPQRFRAGPPVFLFLLPMLVAMIIATVSLAGPWILWGLFWIVIFSGPHHRGWHHPPRR
jgi:hypothetical protein